MAILDGHVLHWFCVYCDKKIHGFEYDAVEHEAWYLGYRVYNVLHQTATHVGTARKAQSPRAVCNQCFGPVAQAAKDQVEREDMLHVLQGES